MSKPEWFRRSTWTDHDRDEFNARLKRCRGAGSKAQYLRIQACHLAEAGLHANAIELLDCLIMELPERMELANAHLQKAKSLVVLGLQQANSPMLGEEEFGKNSKLLGFPQRLMK